MRNKLLVLLGIASITMPAAAAADTPTSTAAAEQPEIVVTGSRLREESVQDTPIAVSVLSADMIGRLHTANVTALSSIVPNLTIAETGASPGVAAISLRGFNTRTSDIAAEPGVAIYVDGVYQAVNGGQILDTYDLDRIEVLRGPQGTLLGKNAGAGAILLTRSRPTGKLGGKTEIEYGRYNLVQIRGLLNFPIAEGILAGKIFASYRVRDSWISNASGKDLGGQDLATVRGALLFTPNDAFTLYLTADWLRDRSEQLGGRNVSGPFDLGCVFFSVCGPDKGKFGVTSNGYTDDPSSDDNNVTMNAEWTRQGIKLTTITGYRHYYSVNRHDVDHSPLPILETHRNLTRLDQLSQEVRLASETDGGLDLELR